MSGGRETIAPPPINFSLSENVLRVRIFLPKIQNLTPKNPDFLHLLRVFVDLLQAYITRCTADQQQTVID